MLYFYFRNALFKILRAFHRILLKSSPTLLRAGETNFLFSNIGLKKFLNRSEFLFSFLFLFHKIASNTSVSHEFSPYHGNLEYFYTLLRAGETNFLFSNIGLKKFLNRSEFLFSFLFLFHKIASNTSVSHEFSPYHGNLKYFYMYWSNMKDCRIFAVYGNLLQNQQNSIGFCPGLTRNLCFSPLPLYRY